MNLPVIRVFASACLALILQPPTVWAYGGGGGAASCNEATFYDESPARNTVLSALSDIAVVASDNTEINTLEMKVNGLPVKPETTQRRSGEWDVKIHLTEAITQTGKVQITLAAKSKEGCATFFPYYVQIKPAGN